jgi:ribonuclease HI
MAFIVENTEKGYKGTNICTISDSQMAIKVLNNFQINSKLGLDCHRSLVTLAEHDRVQLIWVLGHMGIDGNEVGREVVIVDWIRRHEEH